MFVILNWVIHCLTRSVWWQHYVWSVSKWRLLLASFNERSTQKPYVARAVSDLATYLWILSTSNYLVSFTINDATRNVVNFLWLMLYRYWIHNCNWYVRTVEIPKWGTNHEPLFQLLSCSQQCLHNFNLICYELWCIQ